MYSITNHLKPMLARMIRPVGSLVLCAVLAGCASMQGTANGPNDCVGPPSYCVPFFGS
jgi:hypothetical protein